ncbi:hypothetical protein GCM10008931_37590 [Oceanobacillus oncorhynchi subsp. oncorhynchi]
MIKVTRDIKINFKLEHKIQEKLNSFLNHMIRLFVLTQLDLLSHLSV